MGSVQDWAAKAARYIIADGIVRIRDRSSLQREERIAAIIATFAEPLVKLVRESRREHKVNEEESYYSCASLQPEYSRLHGLCNCGADEWNRKVEEALK